MRLIADAMALPLIDGCIDCILTDPPWHFDRRITGGKAVHASNYILISDAEMARVFHEMNRVLKPGGHLYVFVPNVKLPVAYSLMAEIGMTGPRTPKVLIWVKDRIGLGHDYRNQCEFIVFGIKLPYRTTSKHNISTVLYAKNPGKSRKPVELYQLFSDQSCPMGGVILDCFAGTDPLGAVEGHKTISMDIAWKTQ